MKTCIGCEAGLCEEYLVDVFGQAYCLACWEGETLDGPDDQRTCNRVYFHLHTTHKEEHHMRYSEAIRLGGMMRPKAKWVFYDPITDGVCVQGAALDAIGCLHKDVWFRNHVEMERQFPFANTTMVSDEDWPQEVSESALVYVYRATYNFQPDSIRDVSIVMNNHTDWTCEQIADWVEKMEDKYGYEEPLLTNTQQMGRNAEIATMRRACRVTT